MSAAEIAVLPDDLARIVDVPCLGGAGKNPRLVKGVEDMDWHARLPPFRLSDMKAEPVSNSRLGTAAIGPRHAPIRYAKPVKYKSERKRRRRCLSSHR